MFCVLVMALSGCSGNLLEDFANKNSDQALLYQTKININARDWDSAIVSFGKMSTGFQAQRENQVLLASAYSGRCGLDFLQLVQPLGNLGTTLLLRFLMQTYPGGTAPRLSDCVTSEGLLNGVAALPANRSLNENLLVVFNGFAKIGVALSKNADLNQDGIPDAGFNACSTTSMSDSDAAEVAVSLANILNSLNAISASSNIASGQLSSVSGLCSQVATLQPSYNFCTLTQASSITANQLKGVRSIIQENQYLGIGSCNNQLVNCLCP